MLFILFNIVNVYSAEEELKIYSPNYFNEQNNKYEYIHYVENEFLSFQFCTDENTENIEMNLICNQEDKTAIDFFKDKREKKNCFFSNYDLTDIACDEFKLEISYILDKKEKKIEREFKKQKQSKLINHILGKDPQNLDPEELSYYLIVLNDLETSNSIESNKIYDILKNSRNNQYKCWPNKCEIDITTTILRNLKMAGYPESSRLMQDGESYLQKNLISNNNNPLKFTIKIDEELNETEEISCTLGIDEEDERTYIFEKNDTEIEKYVSNSISFNCDRTIDNMILKIYNLEGSIQKYEEYEDTNIISYTINPFTCIGEDACSFGDSINSLIAYSSSLENSNLIENYINSQIVEGYDESYLNVEDEYEQTGKLLYHSSNEELLEHLKYKQNNDGSWGKNSIYDRIQQTSWAVNGLQSASSNSEYVEDGKKWIYYNEPTVGWGNIEKNTMAYTAIKEKIKPYLKINIITSINNKTQLIIENPTIYEIKDMELSFSENIKPYLSYVQSLGDMQPEGNITTNISVDKNFLGSLTGDMKIEGIDAKNNKIKFIEMPINIEGPLPFTITEKSYMISEDSNSVELETINNIESFSTDCRYLNPFNNNQTKININHLTTSIDVENKNLEKGKYEIIFKCNLEENEFEIPARFGVNISQKSFNISQESIIITSPNDFSLDLSSTLKEKQIISLKVDGTYQGLIEPAEKEKIIAGKDKREIFFTITNPEYLQSLGNASHGNIIIISDSGYIKKIPLEVNMSADVKNEGLPLTYIIIGVITILFILLIIVRYIQLNKEENEEEIIENADEDMYI